PEIDGALVGGASLDPPAFAAIVGAAAGGGEGRRDPGGRGAGIVEWQCGWNEGGSRVRGCPDRALHPGGGRDRRRRPPGTERRRPGGYRWQRAPLPRPAAAGDADAAPHERRFAPLSLYRYLPGPRPLAR